MIITIILTIIYGFVYLLTAPIRLLPDVSINAGIGQAISTLSTYVGTVDSFLPISTLLTVLGLFVSIEVILAGYKIIMWIIRRIPTQS